MNTLIKQAKIIDPRSSHNGQVADIHIVNGIIKKIGKNLQVKSSRVIDVKGIAVSPGWIDIFSDFADPGFEFCETLESGAAAAAAGGYTDVCLVPNTKTVVDQKSVVEYILQKANALPVSIHPMGAVTKNTEGKELAELYDMKMSGAVAFTDGVKSIQSAGLLVKALQYVKSFNGVVLQLPDDKSVSPNGLMNEGITSTQMGMPGRPEIAEEIFVMRDIKLAEYAASNLHITAVSTDVSLKHIKEAKQKKINVTCSATPYHLFYSDEDLDVYDTNLKVNPPLRNKRDRKALQKAVAGGLVDCIATHHFPHDTDAKVVEFEYAKFGMIGLQTTYAVLNTIMPAVPQQRWVELLAINPRKILNLPIPIIEEGENASLTLFNPTERWLFNESDIKSLSKNSPFIGKEFTGRPLGIIHNHKEVFNN